MNGRVYDPELGRFMSADPFVQAPYNSQSYNRYSYVFNNPLSYTDPSGFVSMSMIGYIYADYAGRRGDYNSNDRPPEGTTTTCDAECQRAHNNRQNALNQWNYESWSTWHAVNTHNQQWEYMNGSAYNLANFWGKVAFDLAAGSPDVNNSNSVGSFDASTVAFWAGTTGFAFEQTRGYVGIHRANYLTDWRFYPNGWTGNGYMSTTALAGLGKNLGAFGFGIGTLTDAKKIADAKSGEKNKALASAIWNLAVGTAVYVKPTRFGVFGVATGINDLYGKDIALKSLEGAMAISPNIPHPRPFNNDLDKALEQAFVGGRR